MMRLGMSTHGRFSASDLPANIAESFGAFRMWWSGTLVHRLYVDETKCDGLCVTVVYHISTTMPSVILVGSTNLGKIHWKTSCLSLSRGGRLEAIKIRGQYRSLNRYK